jgi:hypothetical protein
VFGSAAADRLAAIDDEGLARGERPGARCQENGRACNFFRFTNAAQRRAGGGRACRPAGVAS